MIVRAPVRRSVVVKQKGGTRKDQGDIKSQGSIRFDQVLQPPIRSPKSQTTFKQKGPESTTCPKHYL